MRPQRIVFLTLLLLSFGGSFAFAVDCGVYDISVTYYSTSSAAFSACSPGASGGTVSQYSMLHECYDVPIGLIYYLKMTSTSAPYTGLGCIVDPACSDQNLDYICDVSDPPFEPPPDGDGDGLPDDSDPCPANPDTNCVFPDSQPPPDEVTVGECVVAITDLKAWLVTDESFPFNFFYAFYEAIQFVFEYDPIDDSYVLPFEWPIGSYFPASWNLPEKIDIRIDLTPFNNVALLAKFFLGLLLFWGFGFYGLKRLRNFTGIS